MHFFLISVKHWFTSAPGALTIAVTALVSVLLVFYLSLTMRSRTFRNLAWKVSQYGGKFWRWLTSGWRSLLLLFSMTYVVVNIPDVYQIFSSEKQNTSASSGEAKPSEAKPSVAHETVKPTLPQSANVVSSQPAKPRLLPLAELALGIDMLWLLMVAVNKTRQRIFIDEFADYTTKATDPKELAPRVRAVTTLLADQLARSSDLYRKVDQQTAVFARGVDIPVQDANIRTESINDLLKEAVSADTKLRVGFVDIPIGTFMKLLGQLVRGPRLTGGLYKEGEQYILTAQMTGGRRPYSWRVEDTVPLEPAREGATADNLDVMIAELACRIFTDIALDSAVRWRATRCFNEGLRAYRNCLRTPKNRRNGLRKAEKAFMETLADDERFEWAYYNLGLVYTGLGQTEAAAAAFQKSIDQDRSRWEPYYALAQIYFEENEEENHVFVIGLCERVIILHPSAAKGYRLLCQAQYKEAQRKYKEVQNGEKKGQPVDKNVMDKDIVPLLEKAQKNGERAVANSWKDLCQEYWHKRATDPEEDRTPQHIKVTRDCLCGLADVYMFLAATAGSNSSKLLLQYFQSAEKLYRQADALCPSDPDVHLGLGRLYLRCNDYKCAIYEFRYALRMDTTRADLWAYLWLTSDLWKSVEKPSYPQRGCASSKKELGLLPDEKMGETAHKELFDLACDASPDALTLVMEDFELLCDLNSPGAETCRSVQASLNILKRMRRINKCDEDTRNLLRSGNHIDEALDELNKMKAENTNDDSVADLWVRGRIHLTEWRLKKDSGEDTTDISKTTWELKKDANPSSADTAEDETVLEKLVSEWGKLPPNPQRVPGKAVTKAQIENAWEYAQLSLLLGQLCMEAISDQKSCLVLKSADRDYFKEAINALANSGLTAQIRKQALRAEWADALLLAKDMQKEARNVWNALEQAGLATELDPMSVYERSILGKTFAMLSEMDQACSAYEVAKLGAPDDPALWLDAGKVHLDVARNHRVVKLRRDMLNKAVSLLTGALERYGNSQVLCKGRGHYMLGQVQMEMNDYAKAVCHFRSAEAYGYAPTSTLFSKGWALLRSQQFDTATEAFEEVIHRLEEDLQTEEVGYWNIVDKERDIDRKRPVGQILVYAYLGKAFALLDQEVGIGCDTRIQEANSIIDAMQKEIDTKANDIGEICKSERQKHLRLCRQLLADCQGWLALKQEHFGYADKAIAHFKEAIALCADPGTYYHLALAYEIKLWDVQGNAPHSERRHLLQHARAHCENARRCDLNEEYKDRIDALKDRLQLLEQSPPPAAQPNSAPEMAVAVVNRKVLEPSSVPAKSAP